MIVVTIIKLGGSLITNKHIERSFHKNVVDRLAGEIVQILTDKPNLPLIIGHGSGSFGHFEAKRYNTMDGVRSQDQWKGFAQVATAASELNFLVARSLSARGLPIWRLQPSASTLCRDGEIISIALHPIIAALKNGLIPLIFGDVALDEIRGGTITSTETIIEYLAHHIPIKQIVLLGEVDGVLDKGGQILPEITLTNIDRYSESLGGSSGIDVTGGMYTKVHDMLRLVNEIPDLQIRILSGLQKNALYNALTGISVAGTLIYRG